MGHTAGPPSSLVVAITCHANNAAAHPSLPYAYLLNADCYLNTSFSCSLVTLMPCLPACSCAIPHPATLCCCCHSSLSFILLQVAESRHPAGLLAARGGRASSPRQCSTARGRLVSDPTLPQAVLQQTSRRGAQAGERWCRPWCMLQLQRAVYQGLLVAASCRPAPRSSDNQAPAGRAAQDTMK